MAPALPTIPAPRANTADVPGARNQVHGRDDVLARLLDVCRPSSGVRLAVVTGPAGIGRSAVLARTRELLAHCGVGTVDIRLAREECPAACLTTRLADELGAPATLSSPMSLNRLLTAVTERRGPLAVFLDDAQRIGPRRLPELVRLIEALTCAQVTFVCAVRTPFAASRTALDPLRHAGLVHEERLRPLSAPAVRRIVSDRLQAVPTPELLAAVRNASRGIPAFVHGAVDAHVHGDCVQVVDQHACLGANRSPRLWRAHPLAAGLRELGAPYWLVLKALSLLHPLSGPVPALIAEVVGLSEQRVREVLRALREAGVLRCGKGGTAWTFRVPLLATVLDACLGPFERRRISARAVTALWRGEASCADHNYLPKRLAGAGRLIDPERAASTLIERSAAARPDEGELADSWASAAARLVTDPARHAEVLHRHAVTCGLHLRFDSVAQSARTVLLAYPDQLTDDSLQEALILHVLGLAARDPAALRDLADDPPGPLTGRAAQHVVTRAAAFCLLDQWGRAYDELTRNSQLWTEAGGSTALFGTFLSAVVGAVLGRSVPTGCPGGQVDAVGTTADVLLIVARALDFFAELYEPWRPELPHRDRTRAELTLRAGLFGKWDEALVLARSSIAGAATSGRAGVPVTVPHTMAAIYVARGQLKRARTVIEAARSQHPLLSHVLAAPESELEATLGAHARSRACIERGLAHAAESGALLGTDMLLLRMTIAELHRGNLAAAQRCAARIEQIAQRLGTPGARRYHLLARVLVEHDAAAAAELVELAEELGRPFELACALGTIAASGLGDGKTVLRAYELFGDVDALIMRVRLRRLMRERGISVPGRATTVSENERLLATLVADGLTNAEIATVLGATSKSVEGRLTRLFQRTGLKSRAELATAALGGRFRRAS
ncbi:hypothetical protein GCM10011581_45270 [Saccharopolyspora subtropica]|uniref:HTH luxR-type domain-containing protein n=1 Tax=Saccharopolyspora thermophila TaxID=89367 RepID=A0A917KAB7_9PSEU|nr:AAA family ATPase [Saccharopolyspora subtropica]GGJ03091.1 hypothetical protein GCM10011581_45270 [Saccharopolyspora subtropica]